MIKEIEINEITYQLKTSFDDLTLGEWSQANKILADREKRNEEELHKHLQELNDDVEYSEYNSPDEETDEFRYDKYARMLNVVSGIPIDILKEYTDIIDTLIDEMEDIYTDDSEPSTKFNLDDEIWHFPSVNVMTFQQWCDAENMLSINLLNAFCILLLKEGKQYDRFHPDFDIRLELFGNEPAKGYVSSLLNFLNEMSLVRENYKFLYGGESTGSDADSPNQKAHADRFKWEEVIRSLAETQVFNSPTGTLNGVRTANTLDVLDYLNVKRSKDIAESKDFKARENRPK
jgi:hypothetical protein